MMILHSHLFLNGVTGTAGGPRWSTPYPTDWHFDGNQRRTFMVSAAAADTVTVQATNNFEVTAGTQWYNVTAATGQTSYTMSLDEPMPCIRVGITGGNGATTVRGVV